MQIATSPGKSVHACAQDPSSTACKPMAPKLLRNGKLSSVRLLWILRVHMPQLADACASTLPLYSYQVQGCLCQRSPKTYLASAGIPLPHAKLNQHRPFLATAKFGLLGASTPALPVPYRLGYCMAFRYFIQRHMLWWSLPSTVIQQLATARWTGL